MGRWGQLAPLSSSPVRFEQLTLKEKKLKWKKSPPSEKKNSKK